MLTAKVANANFGESLAKGHFAVESARASHDL